MDQVGECYQLHVHTRSPLWSGPTPDHVLHQPSHIPAVKEHVLQTAHSVANQKQHGMMGSHKYIDLSWSQTRLAAVFYL